MQSTHSNSKPIKAYLPLKQFHILPIYGLSPDDIKLSVQNVSRDREKIGHCALLNACAKSLGFSGGFAGYQQEYQGKLLPFMKQHNLEKLCNLVQPRFLGKGYCVSLFNLKYQNVSERFFFSGQTIPEKLFTGYDFKFDDTLEDGIHVLNQHIDLNKWDLVESFSQNFEHNIQQAMKNPDVLIDIYGHDCVHKTRKLIDVVIGAKFMELCMVGLNLITDQLVYPRVKNEYELCLYRPSDSSMESYIQDCNFYHSLLDLFIHRIESQETGWVGILPYNENLIFLKGKNGEYDFVFKNQRDNSFCHQIYAPYLKRAEVPKFDDTYHFERWYYFEFSGFRQRVEHLAEQKFYAENAREDYHKENIVKTFLESEYKKATKPIVQELEGFQKIKLKNGKILMVSDLVTIEDFEIFKSENTDYFTRREQIGKLDKLDSVNCEADKSLPVTVTGYDVWKYIHWFNQKHQIETRLLDDVEYKEISPFSSIGWDKETETINNLDVMSRIKKYEELRQAIDLEEIQNIAFISKILHLFLQMEN